MRLYKIYSGLEGFSEIFCLVIANNESEAIGLAIEKFEDYTHCTAEVVFDDLTVSKSSEPSE